MPFSVWVAREIGFFLRHTALELVCIIKLPAGADNGIKRYRLTLAVVAIIYFLRYAADSASMDPMICVNIFLSVS